MIDAGAALRAATKAAVIAGAAKAAAPAPAAPAPAAATPAVPPAAGEPAPAAPPPGADTDDDPPPSNERAERALYQQLASERARMQAEFEAQLEPWKPRVQKALEIERKLAAAGDDPIAAIQALGYSVEDFEHLGHLLYAATPEGQKDPKRRAWAMDKLAGRKQVSEVQGLKKQLDDLKGELTQREQQATAQAQLDAYASGLVGGVADTTPLAKARVTASPAAAREALVAIADKLYTDSGDSHQTRKLPTPAQVVAAYEKSRTAELEALRPEYEALSRRTPAAPTPPATPAAKAAPVATPPATPPAPPPAPSRMTREEILAGIADMKKKLASPP